MDFIVTDDQGHELSLLQNFDCLDFDLGERNDFELKIDMDLAERLGLNYGGFIYAPRTEYCGVLENKSIYTGNATITWTGTTIRGLLAKDILTQNTFNGIRSTGDANEILEDMLHKGSPANKGAGDGPGDMFHVPQSLSGLNYPKPKDSLEVYKDKLYLLNKLLGEEKQKIKLWTESGEPGNTFAIMVAPVPIVDYSDEVEYSQDMKINFTLQDNRGGINHLICLGKPNAVDLFVDTKGEITNTNPGVKKRDIRMAVHDFSLVEPNTLEEERKNKLRELASTQIAEIEVLKFSGDIGDIIGSKDERTGVGVKACVTGLVYRKQNNEETVEVKIDGGIES